MSRLLHAALDASMEGCAAQLKIYTTRSRCKETGHKDRSQNQKIHESIEHITILERVIVKIKYKFN